MKTKQVCTMALACIAALVPALSWADAFDNQFEMVKALGDCGVKAPDSPSFVAAVDGSKHAYGTVVKTGRNSSAIIRFSQFNGCRIYARSTVAITEDMKNKRLKVLKLDEPGKVQIKLDPSFRKNNDLKVETPSAVCGAIGCNFTVDYQIIADLRTTIVTCSEGETAVAGSCFLVSGLGAGSQLTVSKSPQGNFIRIKMVSGSGVITVKDRDGNEREVPLAEGDEIRIMAERSEVDDEELILIYEFNYADPKKEDETYQPPPVRIDALTQDLVLPSEWPNITVTTTEPGEPSPTPVGKRGDEPVILEEGIIEETGKR